MKILTRLVNANYMSLTFKCIVCNESYISPDKLHVCPVVAIMKFETGVLQKYRASTGCKAILVNYRRLFIRTEPGVGII